MESAVVRALFPLRATRALISAIGKAALVSAVSEVFPLANAIKAYAANAPVDIHSAKVGLIHMLPPWTWLARWASTPNTGLGLSL